MTGLLENSKPTACYFQWNSWKLRLEGHPSNLDRYVEQIPLEWKNGSPEPYPWKKSYFWKNKTFFWPTFPFPLSPGLSSLPALRRQLSCQSRKVKICPSESFVLPRIRSFRGKVRGIYILCSFEKLVIFSKTKGMEKSTWTHIFAIFKRFIFAISTKIIPQPLVAYAYFEEAKR